MIYRSLCSVALISAFCAADMAIAQDIPDASAVVDTLEKLGGVNKGFRRNHAKGSCVVGSFVGTADARKLSSSALFSGKQVPVVGRFSVAGPAPQIPDAAKQPHGLALEFRLPKDELQHTTMLNIPAFPVSTVQGFYDALLINLPDPATGKPDPEKAEAFGAAHPEAKTFGAFMATHNAPQSYTEQPYNSLHAFKFIKGKKESWVRWHFVPHDGVHFLTAAEAASAPNDFLDKKLTERTRKGPVQWEMIVTIGQKGDAIDNPAIVWPAGRKEIKAGVLTLTKGGADAVGQCEDINFDPNVMSAGIDVSPDQILQYRSAAYAESYSRRENER